MHVGSLINITSYEALDGVPPEFSMPYAGELRFARSTNLAAYKYPSTGRLQTAQKLGLLKLTTAAMKLSISSSMVALVIAVATHAYAAVVETTGAPAKVRGRPPC
jgi:hypothetical protein